MGHPCDDIIREKFASVGCDRMILLNKEEKESFFNNQVVKESVIRKVTGHHDVATEIDQTALRGYIEDLGYTIEE